MKLSFQHVSGEKKHDRAISVCAYMSDRFDANKHLRSFSEFVINGQEGYDILVFREPGMSVPVGPTTRVFDVTSPELGYARHMWRYLGGELGYDWTWFRGMDTPKVPEREIRLEQATIALQHDVLMWQGAEYSCTARLGLTKQGTKLLLDYIQTVTPDEALWHCDEAILSNWFESASFRAVIAMDESLAIAPWQTKWIFSRLFSGNHTTFIKDRNDHGL